MKLINLPWIKVNKASQAFQSASPKQIFRILDEIEFRAIISTDKEYLLGDLLNEIIDNNNLSSLDIVDNHTKYEDNLAYDNIIYQTTESNQLNSIYPSKISEEEMRSHIIRRFELRQKHYGSIWPFELTISTSGNSCTIKFIEQHEYKCDYIFLLICSMLHIIQPSYYKKFSDDFEKISQFFLNNIYTETSGWTVYINGANNQNTAITTAQEKLKYIIKKLRLSKQSICRNISTSGDNGIDLIAYNDTFDTYRGALPVIFAQCACTNSHQDLENKIYSVTSIKIKKYIPLETQHSYYVFSPLDLHDDYQDNKFLINDGDAIIIDRCRFIQIIGTRVQQILSTDIQNMVNNLTKVSEPEIVL